MVIRPRLLPVVIAASAALFCVKVADIWFALDVDPVPPAHAQTTPSQTAPSQAGPVQAGATPGPAQPAQAKTGAPGAPSGEQLAKLSPADAATSDPSQFSPQEVRLLEQLAKRRAELDKRSSELDQREALLQAAEKRIDEKIAKLGTMQKAIDASADKQDQQQDEKLKSLVKIYETMKPADAARIFEQLDMPVLLDVVERMKELKTAPILASMNPEKAKALTMALADRHQPQVKQ
jgi:flagellar motility protein MotE (MotC chaperone)